ncbi:Actin cytoskeleton-regulatory complex protein sla1 like [Verticillium longisporum]|nr:Actin cytoskeleton-regulatory complex protein sla1 like [Verticillium longisporum]
MEEYAVAAQIYKLSSVDMCELAKNSVKQSGYEKSVKEQWLGPNFHLPGKAGNSMEKTNVPDRREDFRHQTLQQERDVLQQYIAFNTRHDTDASGKSQGQNTTKPASVTPQYVNQNEPAAHDGAVVATPTRMSSMTESPGLTESFSDVHISGREPIILPGVLVGDPVLTIDAITRTLPREPFVVDAHSISTALVSSLCPATTTITLALYDYVPQADAELAISEGDLLYILDKSSDDGWWKAKKKANTDDGDEPIGLVPNNYVEEAQPQAKARAVYEYTRQTDEELSFPEDAALSVYDASDEDWILVGLGDEYGFAPANYLEMQDGVTDAAAVPPPGPPSLPTRTSDTNTAEPPAQYLASGGFHMYNINEMVSVMGKRKKMPTVLGINLATGTILIAPERTQDGPTQEWTAEKMVHYSRETKHVFLELVKPSKSVDFHAGAKDTAEEIVSALGELAGAVRAQGLREEIFADAGKTQKKGHVLYDFVAQGDDEVSVSVGDEVIILDDAKSDEWWQVRRLKNGREGVVPSSYIEATGITSPATRASNPNAGLSTVEQNRLEEIRLTKEAMKAAQHDTQSQRSKRETGRGEGNTQRKSKPDAAEVRTWTDRSKSFSVDAQFLGLKDGKINLHKMNGVKIAVPIAKMSLEDLEYVEAVTGISLDEDKPLSSVKRNSKTPDSRSTSGAASTARLGAGATVEQPPQKPEYDWFQFFLSCDVAVGVCERYAQAFAKESMDESILPDVDASVLRNLGLREGDILKVMRLHLLSRRATW